MESQGFWELSTSGGNPDGFVRSIDLQGANPDGPFPRLFGPASWRFDFVASGAFLAFDVKKGWPGFNETATTATRLRLRAPDGTRLRGIGDEVATTDWTRFTIPLDPAHWEPSEGETFESIIAKGVIVEVDGSWFPGTTEGPYEIGIDNVELVVDPSDLDNDGLVNATDLFQLLGDWGSCPDCRSDLTSDGIVDSDDVFVLLSAWRPSNP